MLAGCEGESGGTEEWEGCANLTIQFVHNGSPGLFLVFLVLVDRERVPVNFLILDSASPELSRQASESLAGRVETTEMSGFGLG
jgi:predicted AAA+ superfamily ATPase